MYRKLQGCDAHCEQPVMPLLEVAQRAFSYPSAQVFVQGQLEWHKFQAQAIGGWNGKYLRNRNED